MHPSELSADPQQRDAAARQRGRQPSASSATGSKARQEAAASAQRTGAWQPTLVGAAAALAVVAALAAAVYAAFGELAFTTDDAFIYTGYVKMAFTPGAGLFSYNLGEHSAGTTGILFYLLLTLSYLPLQFFWPAGRSPLVLEANSWLVAGLCFAGTGALIGAFIDRVCRRVGVEGRYLPTLLAVLALGLCTLHPLFLWGVVSGMENPLSALLVTALAVLCVAPRLHPAWTGLCLAGLVGTRPEWAPLAGLASLLFLLPSAGRSRVVRLQQVALCGAILLSGVLLTFGAMKFYTGQWLPASDGTRVAIEWRRPLGMLLGDVAKIFGSLWGLFLLAAGIAAGWLAWRRKFQRLLLMPAFITLFLLMRAVLGLTSMNIRDRYISYVWPALVLTCAAALVALGGPAWQRWLTRGSRPARQIACALLAAGLLVSGTWMASPMVRDDTSEMFDVHVAPSRWMAANLPAGTVVEMEPAGAIRTFTDLKLVDRVGLTTNHAQEFHERNGGRPATFADFLRQAHVDYLYDYPTNLVQWMDPQQADLVMQWKPGRPMFSGGRIVLLKFRPDVVVEPQGQPGPR